MYAFLGFFDAAFIRLFWALLVDYLVSTGYLLPEQRQLWVDGYMNIVGAVGAIIFIAIWMHHSNKKEQISHEKGHLPIGIFAGLFSGLKKFIIKEKTTTTVEPVNPDRPTQDSLP